MAFSKDFIWGVASSAFQIEGATDKDGKGPHIWDIFTHEGRVYEGHTADIACEHYYRYKEDVAIMKQLGIKAYRFSLNWPRILPKGVGEVNQKGIDFYNRLIDELIANDIEPYITMYHWELPYELHKRGGWLNPDCVNWFGEYARVVSENFSDRVEKFITFNEPQCFVGLGYLRGEHAPGLKSTLTDTFQIAHNVLKAHGQAVKELRAAAKKPIQVGYAPTCGMAYPATDSPEDIEATRRYLFSISNPSDNWTWNVAWFSDPVFLGKYPEDGLKKYAEYLPEITDEDMKLISQPLDFMGENIYNAVIIRAGEDGNPEYVDRYYGFGKTAINWPITPEALYWGPKFLCERYKLPLYITENGMSCHDVVSLDGKVHDPNRIDFLSRYLLALERAIDEGHDIRGYFLWTIIDNFEWAYGYSERFGIVYVDFRTQERIIKDSGYWYKKVIETNGANLKDER